MNNRYCTILSRIFEALHEKFTEGIPQRSVFKTFILIFQKLLESFSFLGYNVKDNRQGAENMKDVNLLVWLTQLGLSVAIPLAVFLGGALWLHNSRGWGSWVIWVGLMIGLSSAVSGFRQSLKAMEQMSRHRDKKDPPPISFNEHT